MAKRRKTNSNRKKHSQNGESSNETFMGNVEESISMPSVSELTSEQQNIEKRTSFENASFDGTLSGIKIDRENITTDFSSSQNLSSMEEISSENLNDNENKEEHMEMANEEHSPNQDLTLGSYFKNERIKKGVSLKNISQNTKISHTNLEYLEDDNFSKLPNKTYVYGYVKSYAKTLGLDQEHCLDLARKHYDSGKNPVVLESHVSPIQEPKQQFNLKYLIFFIAFIGISAGIFLFTRSNDEKKVVQAPVETPAIKVVTSQTPLKKEALTDTEENTTETPEQTVEVKIETPPPVAKKKEEVVQTKPELKKEEVKPVEVKKEEVKVVEKKEEKKAETKEEEEKKIEFTPITGDLYAVDLTKTEDQIDEMIPSRFKNAIIAGYQNVFIKASKGNSWLTYKSDDKPIKKFVLKEGRNLLIRGKEIRLFLGNINAIEIFLNNKPLKLTSASGVKSLVFPQENGTKYKLPLFIYKRDGTVETSDQF
jgi:cytoskeletal protein RodZ